MTDICALQQKNLFILDHVINVFAQHSIKWFAAYGTLLGAVRTREMIPWDDDIDLVLPREDFNRLNDFGTNWFKKPFFLETTKNSNMLRHFIRVKLDGTTYLWKGYYGRPNHFGMYIDIFPIDHIPAKEDTQASFLKVFYEVVNNMRGACYGKTIDDGRFSKVMINNSFNLLMTMIDQNNNSSPCMIQSGTNLYTDHPNNDVKVLPAKCFTGYTEVTFKGLHNKLRIPNCPEELLAVQYGPDWRIPIDYGKLTDESSFIDPNTDYKVYMKLPKNEFENLFQK